MGRAWSWQFNNLLERLGVVSLVFDMGVGIRSPLGVAESKGN
jgi:hypothetical protein